MMWQLFTYGNLFLFPFRGHIILVPEFSLPLEYYLIPFLIIVGICLILIVIFMVGKRALKSFLECYGLLFVVVVVVFM